MDILKKEFSNILLDFHSHISKGKKHFLLDVNTVKKENQNTNTSTISVKTNELFNPALQKQQCEPVIETYLKENEQWDHLREEALSCMRCRLYQSRRSVVFGEGDPKTMLYIVGEAPGADEDLQGKPFVGRAGQLLTKMLAAINVSREKVFICNILKCRPPENRDPKVDEIQSCSRFLNRQLAFSEPKVILALGRFAANFLLNEKKGITKLRGQSYERFGRIIVPTLHPSALLRDDRWKRPAWEDLKLLRSILEDLNFYS